MCTRTRIERERRHIKVALTHVNTHTISAPKWRPCAEENIWGESCVNREYWLTHLEGAGGGEGQREGLGWNKGEPDEIWRKRRQTGTEVGVIVIHWAWSTLTEKRDQTRKQNNRPEVYKHDLWGMRDSPLISPGPILCVMSEAVSCATAPSSPYAHQSDCLPQNTKHAWRKTLWTNRVNFHNECTGEFTQSEGFWGFSHLTRPWITPKTYW